MTNNKSSHDFIQIDVTLSVKNECITHVDHGFNTLIFYFNRELVINGVKTTHHRIYKGSELFDDLLKSFGFSQ